MESKLGKQANEAMIESEKLVGSKDRRNINGNFELLIQTYLSFLDKINSSPPSTQPTNYRTEGERGFPRVLASWSNPVYPTNSLLSPC